MLLSCRNGDTVDFCLGLVTEVFKLSQKHTDAGNFQANRKTAKETKLCASMGDHTDPQEARPTSSFLQNHQQSGTANFIINWESNRSPVKLLLGENGQAVPRGELVPCLFLWALVDPRSLCFTTFECVFECVLGCECVSLGVELSVWAGHSGEKLQPCVKRIRRPLFKHY